MAAIVERESGARARQREGWAIALLGLLLAAGCASPGRIAVPAVAAAPARQASPAELLAAFDGYCRGLDTVSAGGDLDIQDLRQGRQRRLGFRLVAARDSRLYLKGSVAVVTAFEVVADGSRFWFQVPSKKTVWTGVASSEAPQASPEDAPYQALRPIDVTAALLPEPLGEGEGLVLESDPESFSLALGREEGGRIVVRRKVLLERATLRPSTLRDYDLRGDLLREVRLLGWDAAGPRRIDVWRPREGYAAHLYVDRWERNVPVPERAFVPRTPDGYKVEEVRG